MCLKIVADASQPQFLNIYVGRIASSWDRQWLVLIPDPANTKHLYNISTTSAQRLRRWANIVQMLYKGLCLLRTFVYPPEVAVGMTNDIHT